MIYNVLLLPTNEQFKEGHTLLGRCGEIRIYDPMEEMRQGPDYWRMAHLNIVRTEFNKPVVVGRISHDAAWLKNGDTVKSHDIQLWFYDLATGAWLHPVEKVDEDIYHTHEFTLNSTDHFHKTTKKTTAITLWRVQCPTCRLLH